MESRWVGGVPGERDGRDEICSSESRASMDGVLPLHGGLFLHWKRACAEMSSPIAGLLVYMGDGGKHSLPPRKPQAAVKAAYSPTGSYSSHLALWESCHSEQSNATDPAYHRSIAVSLPV